MEIIPARAYYNEVVELLSESGLPYQDLPVDLSDFVVAVEDNALVGVAGIEIYDENALLRSVAVKQQRRSQGIANALINCIEQNARVKNVSALYLLTETAEGYFAEKGFEKIDRNNVPAAVKRSSEFSHVCPQSAIAMVKYL